MSSKEFPPIPEVLLKALEAAFPAKLPVHTNITLTELNVLQGEQRVIQFLRAQFGKQNPALKE